MQNLLIRLEKIQESLLHADTQHASFLETLHPYWRTSAANLIHYLKLRSFDLREIQDKLSEMSISSLAHCEGYTYRNLENVIHLLHKFFGSKPYITQNPEDYPSYRESKFLLKDHTQNLFGTRWVNDTRYTMVTLPTEASKDGALVRSLIESGMNIARINTGHDNPDIWLRMVENIKTSAQGLDRSCKIYFDLHGPKIRVSALRTESGRKAQFVQIKKDDLICLHTKKLKKKHLPKKCKGIMMEWPEILELLQPYNEIWFDDGKIGGLVREVHDDYIIAKVTHTSNKGKKLKLEKGINFPDTRLKIPALTMEDRSHLPFIVKHADMVGYSFVKTPDDIQLLHEALRELGRSDLGIILKIETASAFDNLPKLLLTSMRNPIVGVMVARGDLAVEVGFERISEVQEELLWICEAAHVPVIWATQVLENLAKTGTATRAEITDAAMSVRAECVMLNKGPHILDALKTLRNIMARMDDHFEKKKGMLRALGIAKNYFQHPGLN